jgi:small subunit ribosomal protein S2
MEIDYKDMIDAGVHFGHQKKRWNPKFKELLYRHLSGISIIDLERTRECLERACTFLSRHVGDGKNLLFVGTKRQAQEVTREVAAAVGMPFCADRWLGGCLTNFSTIKKSLAKYAHLKALEESGELAKMHKKEAAVIRRKITRMRRGFEGIQNLTAIPSALFVVDIHTEAIAIREARRLGIPVVAVVDTNSDPTLVDYPIPANDDSVKSLRFLMGYISAAVEAGLSSRHDRREIPVDADAAVSPLWTSGTTEVVSPSTTEPVEQF